MGGQEQGGLTVDLLHQAITGNSPSADGCNIRQEFLTQVSSLLCEYNVKTESEEGFINSNHEDDVEFLSSTNSLVTSYNESFEINQPRTQPSRMNDLLKRVAI